MILRIADVLREVWPEQRYFVVGVKLETEQADDDTRRVLRTLGEVEVELFTSKAAQAVVDHASALRARGVEPVMEIHRQR